MTVSLRAAVLALLTSLALIPISAAPAQAAVTLSLTAPSSVIAKDSTTLLNGKASGAKVGTLIVLQEKVGTKWVNRGSRTVNSTRKYSFQVTPTTLGKHTYRATMKAQLGQKASVSPSRTITVKRGQEVEFEESLTEPVPTSVQYGVSGTHIKGPSSTEVSIGSFIQGEWMPMSSDPVSSLDPTFDLSVTYPQTDSAVMLRIEGNKRYAPYLQSLQAGYLRYDLALDETVQVVDLLGRSVEVTFEGTAGHAVVVPFPTWVITLSSGDVALDHFDYDLDRGYSYLLPTTGTYTVVFSPPTLAAYDEEFTVLDVAPVTCPIGSGTAVTPVPNDRWIYCVVSIPGNVLSMTLTATHAPSGSPSGSAIVFSGPFTTYASINGASSSNVLAGDTADVFIWITSAETSVTLTPSDATPP